VVTAKGHDQAKEVGKQLDKVANDLKVIFTSPLRRSLQTTQEILDSMENKTVQKVFVIPTMREVIESACDVPSDIKTLRKEFSSFDWSAFDDVKDNKNRSMTYWIMTIGCAPGTETPMEIYERIMKRKYKSHEDAVKGMEEEFLKTMNSLSPDFCEDREELWNRVQLSKQLVKEHIKEEGLKDGEVAVVAHGIYLMYFLSTAKDLDQNYELCGKPMLKNCKLTPHKLKVEF
jgi:broad specificity phosphatase PhoE